MAQYRVEVAQDFKQPVAATFKALSDHDNLGKVLGVPVKRIRDGAPGVNGVGSVRRVGGPLAIEETVVALVANKSIDYKITRGGAPLSNHHGRLDFKALPNAGSQVHWLITFDAPPLIGALIGGVLKIAISRGLKRID